MDKHSTKTHQADKSDRPHGRTMPLAGEATKVDGSFDLDKFLALAADAEAALQAKELVVKSVVIDTQNSSTVSVHVTRQHGGKDGMPVGLAMELFNFFVGKMQSGEYVGSSNDESPHPDKPGHDVWSLTMVKA